MPNDAIRAIECCGLPRLTRFCPDCGQMLRQGTALEELLGHVTAVAHRERSRAGNMDSNDQYFRAARESANRWQEWRAALAEIVVQQAAPLNPDRK